MLKFFQLSLANCQQTPINFLTRTMMKNLHQYYMQQALILAAKGRFTARPNPMVGCIIVRDDRIVGQGWHHQAGTPHAEIHALQQAGSLAKNSDVYITLEPCNHTGRTPPCVDALIQAGVRRVIIPFTDPNPKVNGHGIKRLQQQGIDIVTGIEVEAATALNKSFLYAMQYQTPYVIAKWAATADGQLTLADKQQRWITGDEAREHAHIERAQAAGILIGAHTLRLDNPQLTARPLSMKAQQHPMRIILTREGDLPAQCALFSAGLPGQTWVVSAAEPRQKLPGIHYLQCPAAHDPDSINLNKLLQYLFKEEITSLIVEGGTQTLARFFANDLVNEVHLYQSLKPSGWVNSQSPKCLNPTTAWQKIESVALGRDSFTRYKIHRATDV